MTNQETGPDRSKMSQVERLEHNLHEFRETLTEDAVSPEKLPHTLLLLASYLDLIKEANDMGVIGEQNAGYIRRQIDQLKSHSLYPLLEEGLHTLLKTRQGLHDVFEGGIGPKTQASDSLASAKNALDKATRNLIRQHTENLEMDLGPLKSSVVYGPWNEGRRQSALENLKRLSEKLSIMTDVEKEAVSNVIGKFIGLLPEDETLLKEKMNDVLQELMING